MAIPTFDARDGLLLEIVQDLRDAHRLVLALKDRRTAALGYWVGTQHSADQDAEALRVVILPAEASPTRAHETAEEEPLTIRAPHEDLLWQEALKHLQPGVVATVHWAVGWAAVSLTVARNPSKSAGAWGIEDYRRWTVPLAKQYLWPGTRLTPNFVPSYFLGHTTNRRRWRVGQPTWTWGSQHS